MARALQALVDGLTFGSLSQPLERPAAGYLVFAMLSVYLIGLVLLPSRREQRLGNWDRDQGPRTWSFGISAGSYFSVVHTSRRTMSRISAERALLALRCASSGTTRSVAASRPGDSPSTAARFFNLKMRRCVQSGRGPSGAGVASTVVTSMNTPGLARVLVNLLRGALDVRVVVLELPGAHPPVIGDVGGRVSCGRAGAACAPPPSASRACHRRPTAAPRFNRSEPPDCLSHGEMRVRFMAPDYARCPKCKAALHLTQAPSRPLAMRGASAVAAVPGTMYLAEDDEGIYRAAARPPDVVGGRAMLTALVRSRRACRRTRHGPVCLGAGRRDRPGGLPGNRVGRAVTLKPLGRLARPGRRENKGYEGLAFLPRAHSPNRRNSLLAAHEGNPRRVGVFALPDLSRPTSSNCHRDEGGAGATLPDLTVDPVMGAWLLLSEESRRIGVSPWSRIGSSWNR